MFFFAFFLIYCLVNLLVILGVFVVCVETVVKDLFFYYGVLGR